MTRIEEEHVTTTTTREEEPVKPHVDNINLNVSKDVTGAIQAWLTKMFPAPRR